MTQAMGGDVQTPPLLPGRELNLPGRGRLLVRDSGGPADRPVVVLFHGWLATADLNWSFSAPTLTEHFRVIAFDQRGHGRGLRSRERFSFSSCADDAAAVLEALDIERAIAVGYSMGGPIALTLASRHPDRVEGLVLCATAAAFLPGPMARLGSRPLGTLASVTGALPAGRLRHSARRRLVQRRAGGPWREWITAELEPSDPALLLGAGAALARFDAWPWLDQLAMPAAVVVTSDDAMVRPDAQRALARGIPQAQRFEVDANHLACFDSPERFAPVLLDACRAVTSGCDGG